jgi:hypothetical protein
VIFVAFLVGLLLFETGSHSVAQAELVHVPSASTSQVLKFLKHSVDNNFNII